MLLVCGEARAAHDVQPDNEISLTELGYQSALPEWLSSGGAMATVDYIDPKHLLITFGLRGLIPRQQGDPPSDDDRMVGAYVLEVPSGRVLAQTKWHLHDRYRYLWNLGNGNFLLRVRNHLSLLVPRGGAPEHAFDEHPFLQFDNKIVSISISAASDLLTVQTALPSSARPALGDVDEGSSPPVLIGFYHLSFLDGRLVANPAGSVRSPGALALPVSADGMLDAEEVEHDHWQFHFSSPSGERLDLAQFDTSCFPQAVLVSQTEFIAFGCRGSQDRSDMAGFNMNGDFMWQQSYNDARFTSTFSFAPAAGRFAIGRTTFNSSGADLQSLSPSEVRGQEVRVFQTSSGKVLLDLNCTPAMRSGQNFALSADGMQFAVLREWTEQHKASKLYDAYTSREAAIEIYDLPPLSGEDQTALGQRHKFPPALQAPRIDLAIVAGMRNMHATDQPATAGVVPRSSVPEESSSVPDTADAAASAGSASPDAAASGPAGQSDGDLQPDAPRKPPTLYSPGEKPDGAAAETAPNP